jgi:hypothetical protein
MLVGMASLARDLTDAAENQSVLDAASALVAGEATGAEIARTHGAGVAAEAGAACRAREWLIAEGTAVHLSVVWAMYGETGRMVPRWEHAHGEDFVRVKARQLDWLTDATTVTWSVVAVDDGCPDRPPSAEVMERIVAAEGYPAEGHRGITVLRLADVLADGPSIGPAFDRLTSPEQSRKGGSILVGLTHALSVAVPGRHVVAYTDADLSANLAQLGALAAPIVRSGSPERHGDAAAVVAVLGQRYGMPGAVLVKPDGPVSEPRSTAEKPDKVIVLLRHAVRATLIPQLAHVLDTQAGLKAFDAAALRPVLAQMSSFDETFDVELLIHLAQRFGASGLALEPIVFTEDFAATNFPSVDPGTRHLAMLEQAVALYDRFIAPTRPATGEAAALLKLVRGLDVTAYVRLIEGLRAEDAGDGSLFDRRWPAARLATLLDAEGPTATSRRPTT